MDITGRSAVVTGGAGGLGEATVRRLVQDGAVVIIADLADDKGEKLAADLGGAARYVRTDVTEEDSVKAAIAAAQELGDLRVAVNAHGGPVAQMRVLARDGSPMPQELFERTVKLYLSGTFNVLRLTAAAMATNEPLDSGVRGLVVNTASIAGFEGQVGQSDYSAAKGGVIGLGLVFVAVLSRGTGPQFFTPRSPVLRTHDQATTSGRLRPRTPRGLPEARRAEYAASGSGQASRDDHRCRSARRIPTPTHGHPMPSDGLCAAGVRDRGAGAESGGTFGAARRRGHTR